MPFHDWSKIKGSFRKKAPVEQVQLAWDVSGEGKEKAFYEYLPPALDDAAALDKLTELSDQLATAHSYFSSQAFGPGLLALHRFETLGEEVPERYDKFLHHNLVHAPEDVTERIVTMIGALPRERRIQALRSGYHDSDVEGKTRRYLGFVAADEVLEMIGGHVALQKKLQDYSVARYAKAYLPFDDATFGAHVLEAFRGKLGVLPARVLVAAIRAREASAEQGRWLVAALQHGSKAVRAQAGQGLDKLGELAREAVAEGVEHKKKAVRQACATRLEELSAAPVELPEPLASMKARYDAMDDATRAASEDPAALYGMAERLGRKGYEAQKPWKEKLRAVWYRYTRENEPVSPELTWAFVASFAHVTSDTKAWEVKQLIRDLKRLPGPTEPIRWVLQNEKVAKAAALLELLAAVESDVDPSLWLPELTSSSKTVRGLAVQQLAKVEANLSDAVVPLLTSRKKDVRLAAASLLKDHLPADLAPVEKALAKEKVLEIATLLEAVVGAEAAPASEGELDEAALVTELEGTRKKKAPKWLGALPELRLASGRALSDPAVAGLLARLSLEGPDHHDAFLAQAASLFDPSASAWSEALLDQWQAAGKGGARDAGSGPSGHKWAVFQQAFFADDVRVDALGRNLVRWGSNNHHLATWNLTWLARRATPAADEAIARAATLQPEGKVRTVARQVLADRAAARGTTPSALLAEASFTAPVVLSDYYRPANPVGAGVTLDYGPRSFVAKFTPDGELRAFDEDGKALDALPRARKADDAALAKKARSTFSELKKQAKKVSTLHRRRLEAMMLRQHRFPHELFVACFQRDPLIAALGSAIVFRSSTGTLVRPDGDELLTVDHEAYAPSAGETFGIPHPLELTDAERASWGEHLADHELLQPFPQLARSTFPLGTALPLVSGVHPRAFQGMCDSYGYREGKAGDYAVVERMQKRSVSRGQQVTLHITGVGPYVDDPVSVHEVVFQDLLGIPVTEVDPVLFSEVVLDLTRMG